MPISDQDRILNERLHPRIVDLWFALQSLKSVVSFMNTGAHPDDETSAMLAALGFRDGVGLSFACANRGEGGQNDIGTETGADLGALRTREMERAADVLNMRLYWLSESPVDSIFDFGFSKSGEETLSKWGHGRTLQRFVEIVRTERPDIMCPTFLDVPGQHGHHRAMTQAAHEVMGLAADPAFDCDLAPWQVKKLYLPAWGGGGGSYDDEVPPPPETLKIEAKGRDPVTGWSYEHIAQQSRAYHKTQGMGRWWPVGEERDWPLHLTQSHVEGPDESIFSGLPRTLRELGFGAAQDAIDAAIAAFPDGDVVAKEAARAHKALDAVGHVDPDVAHKIAQKREELAPVIRLSKGIAVYAELKPQVLRRGLMDDVSLEISSDAPENAVIWPEHWGFDGGKLELGDAAKLSDGYRTRYDPLRPDAPYVVSHVEVDGYRTSSCVAFGAEPLVLSEASATLSPAKAVLNLQSPNRRLQLSVRNAYPAKGELSLDLPNCWECEAGEDGFVVTAPEVLKEELLTIPLLGDNKPLQSTRIIDHPHISPTARMSPAEVSVLILDVAVPVARVGYVGAGNDRVLHWLEAFGADVQALSDDDLRDPALAGYDTIIIGIFALRFRDGLAELMPQLHDWVRAGGNLITLYHRPWDNWDALTTAPAPLEIGQPSLRWRVTDETAEVKHLLPDHPLLIAPNRIGPEDWDGWQKERGLYFAKSWDAGYQPLLEMADTGEAPHQGAFLVGRFGKGQHIHTSLILHHQMEHLTPGAFSLFANMIASVRS